MATITALTETNNMFTVQDKV